MPIDDIDSLLLRLVTGVELFKNIELNEVTALLRQASRINFESGQMVFEEGAEGHSMYIVTAGEFEVFRHAGSSRVHIAHIKPGEHFGEIALLSNRPRSASVCATKPSIAIRLSKRAVLEEQKAAVQLFRNMAQLLAKRLIHIDEEVILHKTGQHPAMRPEVAAAEAPPLNTAEYAVVRR